MQKDPEYIKYIEQLPCCICGHKPVGTMERYNESMDAYYPIPCKNNAHHVGNGVNTRRDNDHLIVPLCGHMVISGYKTKDCHHKVHNNSEYRTNKYIEELRDKAKRYYKEYCKKVGLDE